MVALAPTTMAAIIAEARVMAPAKAWRTSDKDDDNVAMRQCDDADMTLTPERMMLLDSGKRITCVNRS